MKISSTITIHAPVPHVFGVFTDLSKAKNRISGINDLRLLEGSAQMEVGTKWEETRTMLGKDSTEVMWVSELTKDKSYTVNAESHGTKYNSYFTFEDRGETTEVTWVFEGLPQTGLAKLMSVLSLVFSGSLKKMLEQDMKELKAACES